jgi:hypothetical protein
VLLSRAASLDLWEAPVDVGSQTQLQEKLEQTVAVVESLDKRIVEVTAMVDTLDHLLQEAEAKAPQAPAEPDMSAAASPGLMDLKEKAVEPEGAPGFSEVAAGERSTTCTDTGGSAAPALGSQEPVALSRDALDLTGASKQITPRAAPSSCTHSYCDPSQLQVEHAHWKGGFSFHVPPRIAPCPEVMVAEASNRDSPGQTVDDSRAKAHCVREQTTP